MCLFCELAVAVALGPSHQASEIFTLCICTTCRICAITCRWLVWFNLDVPSFNAVFDIDSPPATRGSLFGVLPTYWAVAAAWAALPVVLAVAHGIILLLGRACYWNERLVRFALQDGLLIAAQILYVPCVLALSRVYVCEASLAHGGALRFAVDPSWSCGEMRHALLMGLCAPSFVGVLVGVPIVLAVHARRNAVFRGRHAHERYIRWLESEFEHGLSLAWARNHVWVESSFVHHAGHVYDRAYWTATMGLLVLVHAFVRSSPIIQADIMFICVALWAIRQIIVPAYRVWTTNALASLVLWALVVDCFWGVMRAHGLVNMFTVDRTFTIAMYYTNGLTVAVVLFFALCIAFLRTLPLCSRFADEWPSGMLGLQLWQAAVEVDKNGEKRENEQEQHIELQRLRQTQQHQSEQLEKVDEAGQFDNDGHRENGTTPGPLHLGTQAAGLSDLMTPPTTLQHETAGGDLDSLLDAREREFEISETWAAATNSQRRRAVPLHQELLSPTRNSGMEIAAATASTVADVTLRSRRLGSGAGEGAAAPRHIDFTPSDVEEAGFMQPTSENALSGTDLRRVFSTQFGDADLQRLGPTEISALETLWVNGLRNARTFLATQRRLPLQFVDTPQLRLRARLLHRECARAALCRHVLCWSLEETVADLATLADEAQRHSLIPKNPDLASLLDGFGVYLQQRVNFYAFTDSRISRTILKLSALRAWMGGRRIARLHIPGVNDRFFVGQTADAASAARAYHKLVAVENMRTTSFIAGSAATRSLGYSAAEGSVETDSLLSHADLYPDTVASIFADILPIEVSLLTLDSAIQVLC